MSNLECVRKLREKAELVASGKAVALAEKIDGGWVTIFNRIADDVEREVAEKYIALPVDRVGEVVHPGDLMSTWFDHQFYATYMCYVLGGWDIRGEDSRRYFRADDCTHIKLKANPLIELLNEFADDIRKEDVEKSRISDDAIVDYAERIRELIGAES